jgi:hypothetical protein
MNKQEFDTDQKKRVTPAPQYVPPRAGNAEERMILFFTFTN